MATAPLRRAELRWSATAYLREPRGTHGKWLGIGGAVEAVADAAKAAPAAASPGDAAAATHEFVSKAVGAVEKNLGGKSHWNGKIKTFSPSGNEAVLAYMDWHGTMNVRTDVQAQLLADLNGTGAIPNAEPLEVIEHELTHSIGTHSGDDKGAFQNTEGVASIEEGFTELSATWHFGDFAQEMGIADRPVAGYGGTLGQFAKDIGSPVGIAMGSANVHYPADTRKAMQWCGALAPLQGGDITQGGGVMGKLADEIASAGSAEKTGVMAQQVLAALKLKDSHGMSQQLKTAILDAWTQPSADFSDVLMYARQLAANGGGTSGRSYYTGEGRQAQQLLSWYYQAPGSARATEALVKVNAIAAQAAGQALTDVQGVGSILARLKSSYE